MENVACDYCGCSNCTEVIKQTDICHNTTNKLFSIVRCTKCGLRFLNPRPSETEIGQYYASQYSFHAKPSKLKLIVRAILIFWANSRLCYIGNIIPILRRQLVFYVKPTIKDPVMHHYVSGRFLDIGCGSGFSSNFWGECGGLKKYSKFAEVYGVEIDDDARALVQEMGISAYKFLEDVPSDLNFSVIRLNWSLEHVHSPSDYFRFISERLDCGGKVIIAVPNYNGLLYRLTPDCVEVPIHLYHFCKEDLLNYGQKYGLKLIEFRTFSYPGMFALAGSICSGQSGFAKPMAISEAYYFQKILSRLDEQEAGNDMIAVFTRSV